MSKITEIQTHTVISEMTIGHKCDVCGKIENGKEINRYWHEFSHQNLDWGNDSYESM